MIRRSPISRLLGMVLCICMVLSMLPGIPLVAEAAEAETMKIYFRNDWKWTDIKIYFWGSTASNPDWPGKSMTYYGSSNNQKYYVYEVPTDVTGIIVNGIRNDGSGSRDKSPDIKSGWYDGITYYMYWNNGNTVKSFNIRDVFACKHTKTETVVGYAATCTKDGLTDGQKCTECGTMVTAQTVIPAGHNFVDEVCSVCGAEQYMEVFFRNDWNWTNICLYYWYDGGVDNKWPGDAMSFYDNDGSHDYYVAKVPADIKGMIINGTKDDNSGATDQSPDITSGWYDGVTYYMHWDGGNKVGSVDIADVKFPCKHTNQKPVAGTAPDCSNPGLSDGIVCGDCGETIQAQSTIPALGHKWTDATCTAAKTCSVCGATEGSTLDHVYTYGCDTHCANCGELTNPDATHVSNESACVDGVCQYGCGLEMPATTEHEWSCYYEKAPTCSEAGAYYYECLLCGDTYEEYPEATDDHVYDNACDAYCNNCNRYRVPGEHDYELYDEQAPTCGQAGIEYYRCLICGHTKQVSTNPTGEHVYDNACDAYCNVCLMPRQVSDHVYDNACDADCNICGDIRDVADHVYDNACDADCNICGDIRFVMGHQYAYECDTICYICGNVTRPDAVHVKNYAYDCCDGVCQYGCGLEMPATAEHEYDNACDAYCNVCLMDREVPDHVYDNACDADCNICGDVRDIPGHSYCYGCDTYCDICGELTRPEAGHISDSVACVDGECIFGCGTVVSATIGHDWNCYYEQAPTCGLEGAYYYQCMLCGDLRQEYPAATGNHTYDNACDVDCNVCGDVREVSGHSYNAVVTKPDCTNGGYTTYTCSACGDSYVADYVDALGHADADNSGRCDNCQILMQDAKLCFATASLEGNIAINFYTLLSDKVANDPDAHMLFTLANGDQIMVMVREAISGELNGETYYVFTCNVNAKEMADDVICQLFYDGGCTDEVTYNVKAYGDFIVNNHNDEAAKALAEAMLNYGAASQIHFGHNTDNSANAGLETPDYSNVVITGFDATAGQGTDLAKLYSASLILKSETTLRFFFQVDSSVENFTVTTKDGQPLEVKQRGGLYYVDVAGIAAKDLDEDVFIVINDGTAIEEVFFNPMSYCQGVQNDTTGAFSAEMKDLVAALYLYNQAANEYFKEG